MPWEIPSSPAPGTGIGALAGAVLNAVQANRQQKLDEAHQQLQDQMLQQQIAGEAADRQIREQQFSQGQQDRRISLRQKGYDPDTLQPYNYGFTPEQTAAGTSGPPMKASSFYRTLAARAMHQGATDAASTFSTQANDLYDQGVKAQEDALKVREFGEKQLQDLRQSHHWDTQDSTALARANAAIISASASVAAKEQSAADAKQHITIELQNLDINKKRFASEQAGKLPAGYTQTIGQLNSNPNFNTLPATYQSIVTQSLTKRSMADTVTALQSIASGQAHNPHITQQAAQAIVNALNTPISPAGQPQATPVPMQP